MKKSLAKSTSNTNSTFTFLISSKTSVTPSKSFSKSSTSSSIIDIRRFLFANPIDLKVVSRGEKSQKKNFKFSVKIPLKVQKAPLVHVSCAFMSLLASRTCWHLSLSRGPFSMTTKPVAMNIFLVKKLNFHSRGAIEEFPECALWNCHSHTCFSHLFHCWVIAHMT